jgi:hypothetical protein
MLSSAKERLVIDLVSQSSLSERKLAAKAGVSRGTLRARKIATKAGLPAKRPTSEGQEGRCPGCGCRVTLPCLACDLRQQLGIE